MHRDPVNANSTEPRTSRYRWVDDITYLGNIQYQEGPGSWMEEIGILFIPDRFIHWLISRDCLGPQSFPQFLRSVTRAPVVMLDVLEHSASPAGRAANNIGR